VHSLSESRRLLPPLLPRLTTGEVRVYLCDLSQCDTQLLKQHRALLSPGEQQKNATLGHEALRNRDAHCRGLLRRHLADLLNSPAQQIRLETSSNGKPQLAEDERTLHFNLSHSGSYAAIGFSLTASIGIDLEQVRRDRDALRLARRFFSPEESTAIGLASERHRLASFYRLWTLKEAYLKACGLGIFSGLEAPRFNVEESEYQEIQKEPHCEGISRRDSWQFWSGRVASDYQLGIALKSSSPTTLHVEQSPLLAVSTTPSA